MRDGSLEWPFSLRSLGEQVWPQGYAIQRPKGGGFHFLLWTVKGEGFLTLGREEYRVGSGWAFCLAPGTPHGYEVRGKGWRVAWLTFQGPLARDVLAGTGMAGNWVRQLGTPPESLYHSLWKIVKKQGPSGAADRSSAAMRIVFEAAVRLRGHDKPERFREIMEWTKRNLSASPNVDALACKANLSRFHFTRTFRKEVGMSPLDYIMEQKLKKSRELLLSTDLPVKSVAAQSGWPDVSHFCRIFRDRTGVYPAEFRKTGTI